MINSFLLFYLQLSLYMQTEAVFKLDKPDFKEKALQWANTFAVGCYFDSNNYPDPYSSFDVLIASKASSELSLKTGKCFHELEKFMNNHQSFCIGYFGYDLKNEIENLQSGNPDNLKFPDLYFFIPENLILIKGKEVIIHSTDPAETWRAINAINLASTDKAIFSGLIESRFNKDEYIKNVQELQTHIQRGDIYEINFCQEFYSHNAWLNPIKTFQNLNLVSPTPFSSYFKLHDKYIISATPERFLSKRGLKLISQPIKGTAKRSNNDEEDQYIKEHLKHNEKEIAENVMIVDLVRNDLTKSAKPGTVKVEEMLGIYSFSQVHQIISTVVCEVEEKSNAAIIENTFPMGSMTGAPKFRAMELADAHERTKRGVYSGALGYFSPSGDFDFNVVIRSILYNETTKYLSFQVGSAITYDSDAEQEYEECLLKAKAINEVLLKK